MTAQPHHGQGRGFHGHREGEQQAAVVLDHQSEAGQVAEDRAAHQAGGQTGTPHGKTRPEQEDRGHEFQDTSPHATPGFRAELLEDVFRLRRAGELEVQGLEEDGGGQDLEKPADPLMNATGLHWAPP